MYRAKDSVYKQLVRNYLYSSVVNHVPKSTTHCFATLSNTCFVLEDQLLNHYKSAVCFSYERDRKIYNEARLIAPEKVVVIKENIFNMWVGAKYSFVWLDFCGSYTDEFMTNIARLVSKLQWRNKSVLSITLARTRGKGNDGLLYNELFKNYKDEGFATHMLQFLPNVENVTRVQYRCADVSTKAVPMNVFNFFINKSN